VQQKTKGVQYLKDSRLCGIWDLVRSWKYKPRCFA